MVENEEINGTLEIDYNRGVIYFHSDKGITRLRICQLPLPRKPIDERAMIDITHMVGVSF